MSSLMSRSAILVASRMSNFAIQLFSPLLLVRILDVAEYGQYQEFMIYAMLLTTLCTFAVDSSLTYFIPRYPDRERAFVSQASAITLAVSTTCVVLVLLAKPLLMRFATYDFVAPLTAYVFFFSNLNWIEYYWVAKRRAKLVLYYSALRLVLRVGVLLTVAYLTRDLRIILWSLAVVEAARVLWAVVYFARQRTFVWDFNRAEIVEQMQFALPVGAAGLVQNSGRSIGKLVVVSTLGPAALAYYATGGYLLPVVRMARKGIEDAIYPELVRARKDPAGALNLWQRVNVLNCAIFFPASIVLIVYAEQIVGTLFTAKYLAAVPVFQVYALFLIRRCFNTDVLLRTTGRTGFMLWGAIGALTLNVALIFPLSKSFGFIGPAVAFIAAEVVLELYFARCARKSLEIRVADLADWRNIARITAACVIASPILLTGGLIPLPNILRVVVTSLAFALVAWLVAYRLGVNDIGRVASFAWSVVNRRSRLKM